MKVTIERVESGGFIVEERGAPKETRIPKSIHVQFGAALRNVKERFTTRRKDTHAHQDDR